MKRLANILFLSLCWSMSVSAQTETMNNATVIEMSKVGLDKEIIIKKIDALPNTFDISTNALIELKKAHVADEVIAVMLERAGQKNSAVQTTPTTSSASLGYSDSQPIDLYVKSSTDPPTQKNALLNARTIALEKSSVNPSRQALEKELLKRKEWTQFNLSIVRYKESADLYMEIGFVHFSIITHRYVWRVYDRRSGIVVAAGETTSWGSLAENIARDVAKKLSQLATK